VVEGGDVGAVVGASRLRDNLRDHRETEENFTDVVSQLCARLKGNILGKSGAKPQVAFLEFGHELAAEECAESQGGRQNTDGDCEGSLAMSAGRLERQGVAPAEPANQAGVVG